jgi:anti-sigma factor RsiW
MTGLFDDHLSLDAVVAYADGEMSMTAYQRAAAHLVRCGPCAADVAEQTAASQYLRGAQVPTMPNSLFQALTSIPVAAPARSASHSNPGEGSSVPLPRGRRLRLGAGALVAGIAVGAVMVTAAGDSPAEPAGQRLSDRTAVSDPSVPTPAWVLRTTVINVLGRSTSTTH